MKRLRIASAIFVCGALIVLGAADPSIAQEHPEHPKAKNAEHPTAKGKISVDDLQKAIEARIAEKAREDGGVFKLPDHVLGKTWQLDLVRVHRDKLARLEDGTYFACVDMRERGGKDLVDVDFFLKERNGKLVFSDTAIHKVDGVARYDWEKKGDRWVKVSTRR
jgi:hypothetical protein